MFMYLDNHYSKSEKLIMTLFQVGAMEQADLRQVLGWDDNTTSKVITSLNGEGKNKRDMKIFFCVPRYFSNPLQVSSRFTFEAGQ